MKISFLLFGCGVFLQWYLFQKHFRETSFLMNLTFFKGNGWVEGGGNHHNVYQCTVHILQNEMRSHSTRRDKQSLPTQFTSELVKAMQLPFLGQSTQ